MSSDPIISELAPLSGAIASTDLLVVQRGTSDLLQAPVSGLAGFVRSVIATTDDVPEGARLYFTVDRANARADARIAAQKGQAEGIMPLDSGGKAPLAYIPDALIGQVKFKGVWDAATNSPALPSATASMGHYYVTSVAGSYGGIDYGVGDWCISDGTAWGKVDNSDAITSFAGRVGAILPIASDYSSFYLGVSAQAADSAKLGGVAASGYSQTSHTHAFSSLTSKPTTLAGYGITDAATAGHTHSGYEAAIGNPSANGYLLSSSTAGVRSWVAPYVHPSTHAQSVIDSSTGWITTALAGKQPAGSYLTTTGTAADSAMLGGQLPSYYSAAGHMHTPGQVGLGADATPSFAGVSLSKACDVITAEANFAARVTNTSYAYAGAFGGHGGCYNTFSVDGVQKGDFGTLNTLVSGGSVNNFGLFVRGDNRVALGSNDTARVWVDSGGLTTESPAGSSATAVRFGGVSGGYFYFSSAGVTYRCPVSTV